MIDEVDEVDEADEVAEVTKNVILLDNVIVESCELAENSRVVDEAG